MAAAISRQIKRATIDAVEERLVENVMNYREWAMAGVAAAIILLFFSAYRQTVRKLNSMSKFSMTLLLDEMSYRRQRIDFLKLIESTKTGTPLALYFAAMLNLEDAAKENWQSKLISTRMWQLNQRALQTGQSITDIRENEAGATENLKGEQINPFPDRERNNSTGTAMAKLTVGTIKFMHRLRNLLGISK
jgi:hypothetical protein